MRDAHVASLDVSSFTSHLSRLGFTPMRLNAVETNADPSPLIGIASVNGLSWLQTLCLEVLVTNVVIVEVLTGTFPDSDSRIQPALDAR